MSHSYLTENRLIEILDRFPEQHVIIVGDFFLDYYMVLDKNLSETSLETGLEAYQVVQIRKSPGAAGTVASILRSLDVQVSALGFTGNDGHGFELRKGLDERQVNSEFLLVFEERFTPTYIKPMLLENGAEHEISRLDVKNRHKLTEEQETEILASIKEALPKANALVILDQVQELNCGVVSDRILAELAHMAQKNPEIFFIGDSREHARRFNHITLKCNMEEALKALNIEKEEGYRLGVKGIGEKMMQRNKKPVFITQGRNGVFITNNEGGWQVPALEVDGPLDIVGAGDSVMASVSAALCAGANHTEAASIGMITASIIVQQIGTTGTATRAQVLSRYREYFRN